MGQQPGSLENGSIQGMEKMNNPPRIKGARFLVDKGGTSMERRTLKNLIALDYQWTYE